MPGRRQLFKNIAVVLPIVLAVIWAASHVGERLALTPERHALVHQ